MYVPSRMPNSTPCRRAYGRPMPSSYVAAKSCWPVPVVSGPEGLPSRSVATIRPSAMPSMPSIRVGWRPCSVGRLPPPRTPHAVFDSLRRKQRRSLLHRSPRTFGRPTSGWTLQLAADVAFAEGMTPRPVSGETIRQALAALKTRWKRAQHWITSPDPAYVRKNNSATGSSGWRPRTQTGR